MAIRRYAVIGVSKSLKNPYSSPRDLGVHSKHIFKMFAEEKCVEMNKIAADMERRLKLNDLIGSEIYYEVRKI